MNGLNWTGEQDALLNGVITEETENTRLAHKIIPEYEISSRARSVSADAFDYVENTVDDETQLAVEEPSEDLVLTKLQVDDEDLARAIVSVRRAVQRLARAHDEAVLTEGIRTPIENNQGAAGFNDVVTIAPPNGDGLVAGTAAAIAALDGAGYREGYVLVAGQGVYTLLHTRVQGAAELPITAVQGLLGGGPVYRSAVLPPEEALVLSIGNGHIDRAVGLPPTLEFLRIENNDEYRFRVYERFRTRFKETLSAVLLRLAAADDQAAG